VVILAAAFVVFGGLWGTQRTDRWSRMGFDGPGSVGSRAVDRAKATLGRTGNDGVVLYRNPSTTVVAT
jgi:hypothetical protein